MASHLALRSFTPEGRAEEDGKARAWPGLADSPALRHGDGHALAPGPERARGLQERLPRQHRRGGGGGGLLPRTRPARAEAARGPHGAQVGPGPQHLLPRLGPSEGGSEVSRRPLRHSPASGFALPSKPKVILFLMKNAANLKLFCVNCPAQVTHGL